MQVWSSGALEARCIRVGVEVWKYEAIETRCRCRDMERYRYLDARCGRIEGVQRTGGIGVSPTNIIIATTPAGCDS